MPLDPMVDAEGASPAQSEVVCCEHCGGELVAQEGRRFHVRGTYACPPFDEDGRSIAGTVASPQPSGAPPLSIWDGSLSTESPEGRAQLLSGPPR